MGSWAKLYQESQTSLNRMTVEMVTRKIRSDGDERGMLVYGYKFRPVLAGPR